MNIIIETTIHVEETGSVQAVTATYTRIREFDDISVKINGTWESQFTVPLNTTSEEIERIADEKLSEILESIENERKGNTITNSDNSVVAYGLG